MSVNKFIRGYRASPGLLYVGNFYDEFLHLKARAQAFPIIFGSGLLKTDNKNNFPSPAKKLV